MRLGLVRDRSATKASALNGRNGETRRRWSRQADSDAQKGAWRAEVNAWWGRRSRDGG